MKVLLEMMVWYPLEMMVWLCQMNQLTCQNNTACRITQINFDAERIADVRFAHSQISYQNEKIA